MEHLKHYKEDFLLLAEAGFIAVNQSDEDAATKLFKAAQLLDPNNILAKVGFGYMHLCKLELKQAAKVFEEILSKDPHNETARTFLGLSLSLNPSECTKGENVLKEALKNAQDPMVKDLAKNSLDFVEKFVKKSPTPAEGKTDKRKK